MCFFSASKLTLNILKKVPTRHPGDAKRPCCQAELTRLADVTHQFEHLVEPSDAELTRLPVPADVTHQFRHLTESSDADPVHMDLDPDLAYINSPVAIATVRIESVEPVIECAGETSRALDGSFTEPPRGSPCAVGDKVQEDDSTDEIEHETEFRYEKSGAFFPMLCIAEAEVGHDAIKKILSHAGRTGQAMSIMDLMN